MSTIFYDFETSTSSYIGQILSFAFVVVDDEFNEIDRFNGLISIKRTELPSPDAIAVNRIDVLNHQQNAKYSEYEATKAIHKFISKYTLSNREPNYLIGFNSSGFDLQYLRTTFIRNGMNPYFKNLLNADLLHTIRWLYCKNSTFGNIVYSNTFDSKLTLRLSYLVKLLLNEDQTHDALNDVLQTIKLAKYINDEYNIDCRTLVGYMPTRNESEIIEATPNYNELIYSRCKYSKKILIDQDSKYALWLDVEQCMNKYIELNHIDDDFITWTQTDEAKSCVHYSNKLNYSLITENIERIKGEYLCILKDQNIFSVKLNLKDLFSHIKLNDFFNVRNIDPEQNVYCIPFNEQAILKDAIHYDKIDKISTCSNNTKMVYNRWMINNANDINDESLLKYFKKYCNLRYNGSMKLKESKDGYQCTDTYNDLLYRISELELDESNKGLMEKLRIFYNNSDVVKYNYNQVV